MMRHLPDDSLLYVLMFVFFYSFYSFSVSFSLLGFVFQVINYREPDCSPPMIV